MFRKSKCIIITLLMLVVLSGCLSKTELSPTFSIPVKFGEEEGNGEYVLVGEIEKLAFQIASKPENETIEIMPIRANQPNKYMWYLWGENLSDKMFKVMATNLDTKQEIIVFENIVLGSALNGSDAHAPTLMEFPTVGFWKLDAYVDKELFGNITVEVK